VAIIDESEWRNGSRKLGLNDHLISRVSGCGGMDALLDHAHNFNDDRCSLSLKGVLDAEVLEEFTRCVWEDHLKSPMARWSGGPARAQTMVWEITGEAYPADISVDHVDSAQRFLTYLRVCHGAEPGKVFQLALKSMGQKNVIRGWGYKRFLAARRALERAGLLALSR
jgi:hypothetical protein